MHKSMFRGFVFVLTASLLVASLLACSSNEDQAQAKYAAALQLEQAGDMAAEDLYRQLLAEYPATSAAEQAQVRLTGLVKNRQKALQQDAFASLTSVQRVVEGYRSVAHRWPNSIKDLDGNDYFFDSDYMSASVSEGFTVYLALTGEAGYRLWSLPNGSSVAFRLDDKGRTLIGVDRAETLAELAAGYSVEAEKGALIFLVPRT